MKREYDIIFIISFMYFLCSPGWRPLANYDIIAIMYIYTIIGVGSEIYDFVLFALPAGEFGIVYKASLAPLNSRTDSRRVVAVKTLKGIYLISD